MWRLHIITLFCIYGSSSYPTLSSLFLSSTPSVPPSPHFWAPFAIKYSSFYDASYDKVTWDNDQPVLQPASCWPQEANLTIYLKLHQQEKTDLGLITNKEHLSFQSSKYFCLWLRVYMISKPPLPYKCQNSCSVPFKNNNNKKSIGNCIQQLGAG